MSLTMVAPCRLSTEKRGSATMNAAEYRVQEFTARIAAFDASVAS